MKDPTRLLPMLSGVGLCLLGVAATLACPASSAASAHAARSSTEQELQQARAATARFHSVERAQAAGYLPPPPGACVSSPFGAMGYHFENHELMQDDVLEPRKPEVLLYERKQNGRFRLTGIEYFIEADRTVSRPVLFGEPFQGPMPGHHPGMEVHYDLHVWLWEDNPRGLFDQWNPNVRCP